MMHEITVGCIKATVPFRFGLTKVEMVQAGGCGSVTEIVDRSRDRRGAAVTGMPCGVCS